jgi:hypothetical protein
MHQYLHHHVTKHSSHSINATDTAPLTKNDMPAFCPGSFLDHQQCQSGMLNDCLLAHFPHTPAAAAAGERPGGSVGPRAAAAAHTAATKQHQHTPTPSAAAQQQHGQLRKHQHC